MRFLYPLSLFLCFVIFAQNAVAATTGVFKKPSYKFSATTSFDDNYFQKNPAQATPPNNDTLYSFRFGVHNTYIINDDWEVPFTIGASYNQYSIHSNSSFGAVDGNIKLKHDLSKNLNISATYAANDYFKNVLGVNELANYAYLSAHYKVSDNLTAYTNGGVNWLVTTPPFNYSGSLIAVGVIYTFSPATSVSAENVWFNRSYTATRNDNRSEIILGVYQSITKDIVGVINYYGITNSSTDPVYLYDRHIVSIGIRYNF